VSAKVSTHHILFPWGAINSSLFSTLAIFFYHTVIISWETCNLGGFLQQCRFGFSRVAASHPLSALFGSRGEQNPFEKVFAITLCLSHEACVYTNINPMWKPQTKCKQFCSKVKRKKAL